MTSWEEKRLTEEMKRGTLDAMATISYIDYLCIKNAISTLLSIGCTVPMILQVIEQNFEQHPEDEEKWISVDERLPKEYQPVIGFCPICDGSDIIESVIYTGETEGEHTWQVTWNHDKFDANITHWKPYPKRPKDAPDVISSLMGLFPGKGV